MKLHEDTVSPLLLEALNTISGSPVFQDFNLVGGTCLSLQLGHRRSIDIDLFTDMEYGKMDTQAMKDFLSHIFLTTKIHFCVKTNPNIFRRFAAIKIVQIW